MSVIKAQFRSPFDALMYRVRHQVSSKVLLKYLMAVPQADGRPIFQFLCSQARNKIYNNINSTSRNDLMMQSVVFIHRLWRHTILSWTNNVFISDAHCTLKMRHMSLVHQDNNMKDSLKDAYLHSFIHTLSSGRAWMKELKHLSPHASRSPFVHNAQAHLPILYAVCYD